MGAVETPGVLLLTGQVATADIPLPLCQGLLVLDENGQMEDTSAMQLMCHATAAMPRQLLKVQEVPLVLLNRLGGCHISTSRCRGGAQENQLWP